MMWMLCVRFVGAKLVKIMDKLLFAGCFIGCRVGRTSQHSGEIYHYLLI